jgi:hypothetical protein
LPGLVVTVFTFWNSRSVWSVSIPVPVVNKPGMLTLHESWSWKSVPLPVLVDEAVELLIDWVNDVVGNGENGAGAAGTGIVFPNCVCGTGKPPTLTGTGWNRSVLAWMN